MKKLSPRNANSHKAVCSLRTDNTDCKSGWILLDCNRVIIVNQVTEYRLPVGSMDSLPIASTHSGEVKP
jgi:hypothetical protein